MQTGNTVDSKKKLIEASQKWNDIKNIKDFEKSKFSSIR